MKTLYTVMAVAAVLSAGAYAQPAASANGAGAKTDSSVAQQAAQQTGQKQLNKQASVNRPTKQTNWSKIKTLFE